MTLQLDGITATLCFDEWRMGLKYWLVFSFSVHDIFLL